MKIYSNNKSLINRTVDVYGVEVKFDKVGSAEVTEEQGAKILKLAPNSFFNEPPKKEIVEVDKNDDSDKELELKLEESEDKVKKLEITIDSLKSKISTKDSEIQDVRKALSSIGEEKKELEDEIERIKESSNNTVDDFKTKYELALKGLTELKSVCKTLEIPEKEYKDLKGDDKEKLIELIVKATS